MSWRDRPEAIPQDQISETRTADVVVIGLGYAGGAAVRAAVETGASVIGVEAMPRERQVLFGRDVGHINSAFLRRRGVPAVDPIDLFNEWMRRAGNRANPSLVMQYCQNCGTAFDWYTDMYTEEELKPLHVAFWPNGGEQYREALLSGKVDVNGYHFWYGTAQFPDPMCWPGNPTLQDCAKANLKKAEDEGAHLVFGEEGVQLISDEKGVHGVITKDKAGVYRQYLAGRGVILAAGDFSGDREMVNDLCVDIADLRTPEDKAMPNPGRKGGGIRMGVWAGGRLESRPLPTMGGNLINFLGPCTFGSLWLDAEGRRFCNEVFGGTELRGFPGNQIGRGEMYLVFDEHYVDRELAWAYPSHGNVDANMPRVLKPLRELIAAGKAGQAEIEIPLAAPMRGNITIYSGATPEELADRAGLSGAVRENLIASIRRYNEVCARGRDDDFGRDPKLLGEMTGTLFLQKVRPAMMFQMLVSVGGFVTDDRQQVLDENYERIGGLYATGNCCGRRFGMQYATPISGVSIGIAITLGREAGKNAAKGVSCSQA